MIIFLTNSYTKFACIAMKEILNPANPTYSTSFTMKYLLPFPIIIIKFTNLAKVSSEFNLAFFTIFHWFLNMLTIKTPYFLYSMPIKIMVLLRIHLLNTLNFIVAQSAGEEFQTFWASFLASTLIMFASKCWILTIV